MPIYHDRVKDTTSSTGTGNVTVSGTAPTSFVSLNTAFGIGNPFIYCIVDPVSGLWETGTGYLTASTTVVRDSVFEGSSGAGTFVNFTAGTKDIFCTLSAHAIEDFDSGAITAKINRLAMP